VLDPDVVVHADRGAAGAVAIRGAATVAAQAMLFAGPSRHVRHARVNGAPGVVVTVDGSPVSVMAFTVAGGRVAAIHALADEDRVRRLDLSALSQ